MLKSVDADLAYGPHCLWHKSATAAAVVAQCVICLCHTCV